jgi:SAM-dependent methyltransferase
MKPLDRLLQRWRISKAIPWINQGDRVLDVGCFDPALLKRVEPRIDRGVGIDPLATPWRAGKLEVYTGACPGEPRFDDASFDCITMLAVLEHIPDREALARECARLLAPGGRVVITVPRPAVDKVLAVLLALRLVKGMSLEQHDGYDVERTIPIFTDAGLRLLDRRAFQFGLNCLFVFERPPTGVSAPGATTPGATARSPRASAAVPTTRSQPARS